MHEPEGARPRARSPFAAAFLSLIFPGLGQLYAGAPVRALAFAAGPILVLALGAGTIIRVDRIALLGFLIDPTVLDAVFVINLAILVYRLVAIIDAYRVAEFLNAADASGDGRAGRVRIGRNPLSIAGLIAIVLVMAGSHVVVARYDMLAQGFLDNGCIFISDPNKECALDATPSPGQATATPSDDGGTAAGPTDSPVPEGTPVGSAVPQVAIPPWDGKERLNILLIGADQRPGEGTFNTDTLIVVSIDPVSEAGRDVQPAARHRGRAHPAGPGAQRVRFRVRREDQRLVDEHPSPDRPLPGHGQERDGRLQRAQGDHGLPLRARHQVLRGGQLRRLQEGRRHDGRSHRQRPGAGLGRPLPVDRRRPAAGLHPERHPAHGRRRGAALRPLAARLERLRSWRPAAAGPALPARAGRPAGADPEAAPAHRCGRLGRLDRHPARPDRAAARAGVADRHQGHPLVRLRAAVVRDRELAERAGLLDPGQGVEDPGRRP